MKSKGGGTLGAQLWFHPAPWRPDPAEALRALQAQFLAETYDLPAFVKERLASTRQAVRITEADGDEYGILDIYRESLALLEDVASRPLPEEPSQQIQLIRAICADSGEGIGNVLDVTGVSDQGEPPEARRLAIEEVRRFCATDRPVLAQAEAAVGGINEMLGRGECICFPFHVSNDDVSNDDATPSGWYFVGNTID
ncbi:MAG: hypothetical protein ABI353_03035 [Isosphaeraceae bacterium]